MKDKKKYYETKLIERSNFKSVCSNNNWEYSKFKEVDTGLKSNSNNRLFNYFYNGLENKPVENIVNTIEHYMDNPIRRCNFKRICKNRNLNFEDFTEILAPRELWYYVDGKPHDKKFYYKLNTAIGDTSNVNTPNDKLKELTEKTRHSLELRLSVLNKELEILETIEQLDQLIH